MSSFVAAFNILTFPGLVLNRATREYYVRKHDVPVRSPDVEELTAKLEEEKEKIGREEKFGESTENTVQRMENEEKVYLDLYEIDEYRDLIEVTSVPFFVSSGAGFFFLFSSVVLFGAGILYWLPPFWLGAAFAVHSLPDAVAGDALWQKSGETESRLRFIGYPLATVSKLSNRIDHRWLGIFYVLMLFLFSWYIYLILF